QARHGHVIECSVEFLEPPGTASSAWHTGTQERGVHPSWNSLRGVWAAWQMLQTFQHAIFHVTIYEMACSPIRVRHGNDAPSRRKAIGAHALSKYSIGVMGVCSGEALGRGSPLGAGIRRGQRALAGSPEASGRGPDEGICGGHAADMRRTCGGGWKNAL